MNRLIWVPHWYLFQSVLVLVRRHTVFAGHCLYIHDHASGSNTKRLAKYLHPCRCPSRTFSLPLLCFSTICTLPGRSEPEQSGYLHNHAPTGHQRLHVDAHSPIDNERTLPLLRYHTYFRELETSSYAPMRREGAAEHGMTLHCLPPAELQCLWCRLGWISSTCGRHLRLHTYPGRPG